MTHVMLIETPVWGVPPFGNRVTVICRTPPWRPSLGPPKLVKLLNPVATQVPRANTEPFDSICVNEPLADTVAASGLKLPEPVVRIVSVPFVAVLGPTRLKL